MFGPVWDWAGRWRRVELNIGDAPERIAVERRNAPETIAYRWAPRAEVRARPLAGVCINETAISAADLLVGRATFETVKCKGHRGVAVVAGSGDSP